LKNKYKNMSIKCKIGQYYNYSETETVLHRFIRIELGGIT